jgi:GAF domain-containing protein
MATWAPEPARASDVDLQQQVTRLEQEVASLRQVTTELSQRLAESLEQQTATAEVLQVISRSGFDLQPVLEALLENAVRLCKADQGTIHRLKGDAYPAVALYGHASSELRAFLEKNPMRPGRGTIVGRALLERRVVQISDVLEDPEIDNQVTEVAKAQLMRTLLAVPMLREGVPIGVIVIRRSEVRPFTEKQIELVTTFADQAVIAIENVRLFQEVEARSRELARSVEELQALGAVSQTVNSTLDLQEVLTTIVAHAAQLSGIEGGAIYEYDEAAQVFTLRATHGMSEELITVVQALRIRLGETVIGLAAARREAV